MKTDSIKKWLEDNLDEDRYNHTLGVAKCAKELAITYGVDPNRAELAGLLHDCAKCKTNDELLNIIKNELNNVDMNELKNYKTLHAPVGEYFAKNEFDIDDPEILSSIRCHTIGKVDMTTFEKVIFLADKIEENTRDAAYRIEILNILDVYKGECGLNLALLRCFQETIKSLAKRELYICSATIDVYNWLLEITKNCKK